MSDWAVGDLAVCVDDGDSWYGKFPCRKGHIYRVTGIHIARPGFSDAGRLGLLLEGVHSGSPSGAFDACRFRKVKPDEHTACESEFVDLLKRSKTEVPAHARVFGEFFDTIARPTETQLWLERVAEELREERMKGQRK